MLNYSFSEKAPTDEDWYNLFHDMKPDKNYTCTIEVIDALKEGKIKNTEGFNLYGYEHTVKRNLWLSNKKEAERYEQENKTLEEEKINSNANIENISEEQKSREERRMYNPLDDVETKLALEQMQPQIKKLENMFFIETGMELNTVLNNIKAFKHKVKTFIEKHPELKEALRYKIKEV